MPFDRRVLHELFIPAGEEGGAVAGQMVAADMTRPPTATRNPVGRVTEVLGNLEDPGVDLKVIVSKYGLPDAFPPEVEEEALRVARPVGSDEVSGRTDFRGWLTVTIDPETARDHDDAVGIERRRDGGYRLAVHIADVAHYVREGGVLDQEAYLRGTSVYFPDRVVPMLPHALSSDVCSLVEGRDRLTQTVVIDLDATGRVEKTAFHDGVIRSAARLSYQQAQAIVSGDEEARARFAPLVPSLLAMDELAKLMRRRRYERGSLDFDLPEPKLVLDAKGEMTGIVRHERLDSMKLVEEFMLAANEAVAEALHRADAGALFRVHEQPDPGRVEEFVDLVASLGYRVPGSLEDVRPEHFQLILRQIEGKPEEKLVSYLLLRTMKLARYHEENLGHFGLATDMYAHFTSPIRRYPDLVVHRALRALRQGRDAGREAWLKAKLPEMGTPPLRAGAPGLGRRARAHRVEEGPLHGLPPGREVPGLRHRGAGLRPLRGARRGLRAGARARLVDDRRLLPLRREGAPAEGREREEDVPPGGPGRGAGGAGGPRPAPDRLRPGGRAGAGARRSLPRPAAGAPPEAAHGQGASTGPGEGEGALPLFAPLEGPKAALEPC